MTETTYDVTETGRRDTTLLDRNVRGRFEREIRAAVKGAVDGDSLGVLLELEAQLRAKIDARIAELNEEYSYADLAAGTSTTAQTLNNRVKRHHKNQG